MRTHTALSRDQIALNALIAAAPAAVVTASHIDAIVARRDYLRDADDRGGLTLGDSECMAREIHDRRDALRREPDETVRPTIPAERLTTIRRDQGITAAKFGLRTGAHAEFTIRVAADGQNPSYRVVRDRRWLGNDKWGTDFWVHRIRLPALWMTLVRPVGDGLGNLNDSRFVLDCLSVTPTGMADRGNIYEVVAVRNGRGNEVVAETIYVRVWSTGQETYYRDVHRALRAKPTPAILSKMAQIEAERVAAMPSDDDLNAMAMLAEEAA